MNIPQPRSARTPISLAIFTLSILLFWHTQHIAQQVSAGGELFPETTFVMSQEPIWESSDSSITPSLAWGDVDNDGDLDLVAGNSSRNYIYEELKTPFQVGQANRLYLNENGRLNPEAAWISPLADTMSVAWGDMDNDGDLDLATGNVGKNSVYLNEGGMLSTQPVWQSAESEMTFGVAWGDLDGDGIYELVASNPFPEFQSSTASPNTSPNKGNRIYNVYDNVKEGRTESSGLPFGILRRNNYTGENYLFGSYDTALADYDNDGKLDIATSDYLIFLGNGTDDFSNITPCLGRDNSYDYYNYTVAWEDFDNCKLRGLGDLFSVRADVDGDGSLEATFGSYRDGITVLSKAGHPIWRSSNTDSVSSLAWGDVDGDGDLDLAAGSIVAEREHHNVGPIRIYRNDTTHHFSRATNDQLDTVDAIPPMSADVDMDGTYDSFFNMDGKITEIVRHSDPVYRGWGDVNNDGYPDLAVSTGLYLNQGEGKELRLDPTWKPPKDNITRYLAWGDVNGDGWLDLALGNWPNSAAERPWAYNDTVGHDQVFLNNKNGSLQTDPVWTSNEDYPTDIIRWFDIDGDGDLDLLARDVRFQSNEDRLYRNDGGTLRKIAELIPHDESRYAELPIDLNQDGISELVSGLQVYESFFRPIHPNYPNQDMLTIQFTEPGKLAPAPNAAQGNYLASGQLQFDYVINGTAQRNYDVVGSFSLDGGRTWDDAVPTAETVTQTLQLVPDKFFTFTWDIFASGVTGTSDDTRFRLRVQPSKIPLPNTIPGLYQRGSAQVETLPLRIRGKQVRVIDNNGEKVAEAFAYLLRSGDPAAALMGSSVTGEPFTTNSEGYLNGRERLQVGDKLFAAQEIKQAYRIPPQLIFGAASEPVLVESLRGSSGDANEVVDAISAEMWVYPTSNSGTLLTLGSDLTLAYKRVTETIISAPPAFTETVTETTAISLTILNQTALATTASLNDGQAHHLAFSMSADLGNNSRNIIVYVDGKVSLETTLALTSTIPITQSLAFGQGYEGYLDEIRLWDTVREPITITKYAENTVFATSEDTLLTTLTDAEKEHLIGYWRITAEDGTILIDHSGKGNDAVLSDGVAIGYKPLFTVYHTSGTMTDIQDAASNNGVLFTPVTASGVQTLTVLKENPLVLFDLDVSLEWDARNDTLYLQQLEDSFQRASALLYDVTDGQVALGQINLFYNKAYWGVADIVIMSDNSLRPSAAIGGVVNRAADDPDIPLEDGIAAYLPGKIRMGTSWDPYGENTADLGEQWSRALAHELAHYLLFLPDNYLGIEENALRRVVCPGSFMTTTSDPSFSEFLNETRWQEGCLNTLANLTTQRSDWDTITRFFPMLNSPISDTIKHGPSDLPLAVTHIVPWAFANQPLPWAVRNFDIRDPSQERTRLPDAQAFLIKTQADPLKPDSTANLEDDVIIALGSPTGGGDRLKVRGATTGDKLCVLDNSREQAYSGCIEAMNANIVAVPIAPIHTDFPAWKPKIIATANSANSVTVDVEQAVMDGEVIHVQVYPLHYGSVQNAAPAKPMVLSGEQWSQTLYLPLPAYEIAVRVWIVADDSYCQTEVYSCIREAVTTFRLNPEKWEPEYPVELPIKDLGPFIHVPIGNPDRSGIGGPDRSGIGGPDRSGIGGAVFIGNPDRSGIGGPDRSGIGGPDRSGIGGPDRSGIGGASQRTAGSTSNKVLDAPMLSADSQVVIYNSEGYFADNGVKSLQALAVVPEQAQYPWFVPVGQAYRLVLENRIWERYISFTYLQREVPVGYEYTLKIMFMADGDDQWKILERSTAFPENLIVSELYRNEVTGEYVDGVYAVMATVASPLLEPGWNLLAYTMPQSRFAFAKPEDSDEACLDQALASLIGRISYLSEVLNAEESAPASVGSTGTVTQTKQVLEQGKIYWVHLTDGHPVRAFFAPPERLPDGRLPSCAGVIVEQTQSHDSPIRTGSTARLASGTESPVWANRSVLMGSAPILVEVFGLTFLGLRALRKVKRSS